MLLVDWIWPPPISTLFPYTTLFRSRMDEAITLLRAWWGESQVDFAGPRYPIKAMAMEPKPLQGRRLPDRKSTRLNSSHRCISYAVFCLKKKSSLEIRLIAQREQSRQ